MAQDEASYSLKGQKVVIVGGTSGIGDIGHAAVFLMTNPYVTGAVLEVSGGETLVSLEI